MHPGDVGEQVKVGLALAGGGASGGAHIGVIRALEEADIPIDVIGGTSSGAAVAGLHATGRSAAEMLALLPGLSSRHLDFDWRAIGKLLLRKPVRGIIRGNRLLAFLNEHTHACDLAGTSIPLAITATDLQEGCEIVFASRACDPDFVESLGSPEPWRTMPLWKTVRDGQVATAIRASMSIPLIFEPVCLDGRILVDGGLVDNCPVTPVRALGADFVIASDTIVPFLRRETSLPQGARAIFAQMININLAMQAKRSGALADILLTPAVGPIGALELRRLSAVAEIAYDYTRERVPEIRRRLDGA